jgi:hypothetical protein
MADDKKSDSLTGKASIQAGTYVDGKLQMTPSQKAAAGPQPDIATVSMDVLRDGSYGGEYRHAGDTVDVPEDHVETLALSGFAARADRVERAQDAREADAKAPEKSTAVAPMGTPSPKAKR